jgi:hypothetical protein
MKLKELFIKSAETGLKLLDEHGSMPPGHNGPHHDPETPVRNTSHWLIIYLKAYELSGDSRFKNAADVCLNYLLSNEARPGQATFYHRKNPKKDFSNGIIGQAWTLEALAYSSQFFSDPRILQTAEEVFTLHPYDQTVQAWRIVNPDGTILGFDRTFNHQLWFASIGCNLIRLGVSSAEKPVQHFIQHLHKNIEIYPDGVIKHYPYAYSYPPGWRKTAGRMKNRVESLFRPVDDSYSHSVGYHAFNTYALEVIFRFSPESSFFNTGLYRKTLDVFDRKSFQENLSAAEFGFPYNPPGIEIAVSIQSLQRINGDEPIDSQQFWLNEQFARNFDFTSFTMTRNTPDPNTYQARLYELYRLDNFEFTIDTP